MLHVFRRLQRWATRKPVRPDLMTFPRIERLEERCVPSAGISEFGGLTATSGPLGITLGPEVRRLQSGK